MKKSFKRNYKSSPGKKRDFGERSERSFGAERSFGREREFGGSTGKTMHPATCDICGTSCEVPFKPRGDKPVLCSNCFKKADRGGDRESRPARPSFGDRERRPSFRPESGNSDNVQKQLDASNQKLDTILRALDA